MARGDIAVSLTLAPEVEKVLTKLALKAGVSRKEIVTRAIKLLAEKGA